MGDKSQNEHHQHSSHHTIVVMVRYITSSKQFVEQVSKDETLSTLKSKALDFFKLVEDGAKTYQFSLDGLVQTNLAVTLGSLAGDKHELKFNLTEVLKQG